MSIGDVTKEFVFKGPKTLSVMPTFQCTAACADCGTLSSPYDKTSTNLETILSAIDQASQIGFSNIVFTGGEATLKWDVLLAAVSHAHNLGLPTRLVTNAFWAVTPEKAASRIDALQAAGLDEINYSTGDEHCKYVPIERVINAIITAIERKLPTAVMIELRTQRSVTKDTLMGDARIRALDAASLTLLAINESPWMPLDPTRVENYPAGVATNNENVSAVTGCTSVLQTYVLQPDGRIGSCCGLGLRMIPELNVARADGRDFLSRAVEEAESDFLKLWIHYIGPERILAWAAEKNPDIAWENMYGHRCQACVRLYKDPTIGQVIREHHSEMIAEILQTIWLEQEYLPMQLDEINQIQGRHGEVLELA
jgi:organic radical activating enzyme